MLTFEAVGGAYPVRVRADGNAVTLHLGGRDVAASVTSAGSEIRIQFDGVDLGAGYVALGEERYVFCGGEMHRLRYVDPLAHSAAEEAHPGHLSAPMSGTVVAVLVQAGEAVAKGAPLLVLEAMKMEHTIKAPAAGRVGAIHYRQGEQVAEGAALIDLDGDAATPAA